MITWEVVGFKKREYTSVKTGKEVKGYQVSLVSGEVDDEYNGMMAQEIFYNCDRIPYVPHVNDTVNLIYGVGYQGKAVLEDIILA